MGSKDVTIEEFLDLAGHELRIPVTALKGQLQLMRRRWHNQGGRESELADLDRLLYHTDRLNAMVQVLLDAFHVAKGDVQLLPTEYDYNLGELVARFVGASAAANRGFAIRFVDESAGEAPLMGNWDRARVEMILSVLLSNATKYSSSGEIEVCLAREGNAARIEVSDQGIGVPAKERARIFEAYTHGSNVDNPGAGLGLYVAREAARAHGGEMGMRPRNGDGSVFWVTLPLERLAPLSARLRLEAAAAASVAATSAPADAPKAAKKPTRARATGGTKATPASAKKAPVRGAATRVTPRAASAAAKPSTPAAEHAP